MHSSNLLFILAGAVLLIAGRSSMAAPAPATAPQAAPSSSSSAVEDGELYSSYVSAMQEGGMSESMAAIESSLEEWSRTRITSTSFARVTQTGSVTLASPWLITTTTASLTSTSATSTFQSFSTPNASPPEASLARITQIASGVAGSEQISSGSGNSHALAIGLGVGLGFTLVVAIAIGGVIVVYKKRRDTRRSFEARTANLAQRMAEAHT